MAYFFDIVSFNPLLAILIVKIAVTVSQQHNYYVEAFQQEDDVDALVLKIKPVNDGSDQSPGFKILQTKQARQEEEDDDDPSSTPFVPTIIPGLTKIFNGIVTGNLNEIFHGSTSFAPKNVSYAIDTVYNQVVGLPPPKTTVRTTTTVAPLVANVTAVAAAVTQATDEDEDGTDVDTDEAKDIIRNRHHART